MTSIAQKVLVAGFTGEEAREITRQLEEAENLQAAIDQMREDLEFDLAELKTHVRRHGDQLKQEAQS